MKKAFALLLASLTLLLCGCSGGSIYSNYRETEQLTVIQTLGIDITAEGIRVSVATGTGITEKPVRMSAVAESIELALQRITEYSVSEEMFFAHTAYVLVGEETARQDIRAVLDYIERSHDMRLGMPVFTVKGGSASGLVLGAGDEEGDKAADYDITEVLRSVERSIDDSGNGIVFSAAQIIAALDERNSALVCAVESRKAEEALDGAGNALTAIPAGFAVIKGGKMVGEISADDAPAVSVIMGKAGPTRIALDAGVPVTVQLGKSSSDVTPVFKNGSLSEIWVGVSLSADVTEAEGKPSGSDLSTALKAEFEDSFSRVLGISAKLGADFLGLGGMLERKAPVLLRGACTTFGSAVGNTPAVINVSAEVKA